MELYSKLSDTELTLQLKMGNGAAFTEIYNRYKGVLYIHAYKRLNNREEVYDILHELFTTLWAKRESIDFNSNLSGYLYKAVRNRILDFFSARKVRTDYVTGFQKFIDQQQEAVTDYLVREKDLINLIEKEIGLLPPKMREVFELSRKANLSHKEIAEKLSLSEKTVKKHINNALKILRVKLGFLIYILLMTR